MNRVVRSTNVRGFDRQTRHLYVPHESAIPELEDGTPVGSVYEVWANQRKDNGSLPTTDNLPDEFCMIRKSLDVFIAHSIFGKLSICRKHDSKLVGIFQNPFTLDCLEQEIRRCAHDAKPRCNHIFETVADMSRRLTRQLLPRAAPDDSISNVAVFERNLMKAAVEPDDMAG
ncbi:MAG: hypothetical protein ACPGQV_17335 [Alphaproteobacteria bacterium]